MISTRYEKITSLGHKESIDMRIKAESFLKVSVGVTTLFPPQIPTAEDRAAV